MSRLPFELMLAFRYLRPKRTFVSVITVISIIGVMLGVGVLIVVISVMSGFDHQLRESIIGFSAHLKVEDMARRPLKNYRELIDIVSKHPSVTGAAPFVAGPTVVETQGDEEFSRIAAPVIRGIDPKLERSVSSLTSNILIGDADVSGQGLLVGKDLADALGLRVGMPLAVYSQSSLRQLRKALNEKGDRVSAPMPDDYIVTGIFDAGYYEYNANVMVGSLYDIQDLFGLGDQVHGIFALLEDPYLADQVALDLERSLPPEYHVVTWWSQSSGILNALVVEKNMIRFLLFFIVLVAAFGITSSQITFVVQKTREIGMLKALGARRGQVMWLFLSQSLVVGFIGVLAGLGMGMLALNYRNEFLRIMNRITGFELFPENIYGFTELPAIIDSGDIAVICGGSLFICLLAGFLPAINAVRLRPVEALRNE